MTGQQSLIARTALGIVVGGISSITCFATFPDKLSRSSFDRWVNVIFVTSRLSIYACIFLVFRIAPRGDVFGAYWVEAKSVLNHLLPYRDFASSYAPLHPYLDALILRVWYSPLAIILFAICIEALILPLWLSIGRTFLAEKEVRLSALLYVTSAMSVQFVAIDGQDNVVIGALLVLALGLIYRSRIFASGAAIGLGVAAVKFLPLLYVPAFLTVTPRRLQWTAGVFVIILIVYGAFLALHLPVLTPLLIESTMRSSGNLPYLVEAVSGITFPAIVWNSLVFLVCGLIILLIASKSKGAGLLLRLRTLTFGFAALTLALVLFSKKSWPPYLMMCLFPLGLLIKRENKLSIVGFSLFQVVAVVTLSFWSTILHQNNAREFHLGLLAHEPSYFLLLGLQIALVVGYWLLLNLSLDNIRHARLPAELVSQSELVSP